MNVDRRAMPAVTPSRPGTGVQVELVGHATLRIHAGGKTLLTDPWFVEPICAGSCFHFPPLVHDLATVAATTDVIHLSHAHPDHFHPPTLAAFPRSVPIYIGRYRRKGFRDAVRALGFEVFELPFGEPTAVPGTAFEITALEHDSTAPGYDSALVVRAPGFTLLENNDCVLHADTYRRVRERFTIDYAFLGYASASAYPIVFEMPPPEKDRLLRASADRRFDEFLESARLLAPRLTIPFANGMRFLAARSLWRNRCFASADEAVRRARAADLTAESMRPGDRIASDGTVERVAGVVRADDDAPALAAYADTMQEATIAPEANRRSASGSEVVERFRAHVLGLWRAERELHPGMPRPVIAYDIVGAPRGRFHFDFTRADAEIFAWDHPVRYDMRYTYPVRALELALDGTIEWEEVHFADDVSIHQLAYAAEYWTMLQGRSR